MKLIVPVFQMVDGTPIIGMRRRRLSNSIRCKLCAEGCPVFYAGQPILLQIPHGKPREGSFAIAYRSICAGVHAYRASGKASRRLCAVGT